MPSEPNVNISYRNILTQLHRAIMYIIDLYDYPQNV